MRLDFYGPPPAYIRIIRSWDKRGKDAPLRDLVGCYVTLFLRGIWTPLLNSGLLQNITKFESSDFTWEEAVKMVRGEIFNLSYTVFEDKIDMNEAERLVGFFFLLMGDTAKGWQGIFTSEKETRRTHFRELVKEFWRIELVRSIPTYKSDVYWIHHRNLVAMLLRIVAKDWTPSRDIGEQEFAQETLSFLLSFLLPERVQVVEHGVIPYAVGEAPQGDVYLVKDPQWERNIGDVLRQRLDEDDWKVEAILEWLTKDDEKVPLLVKKRLLQALAKKAEPKVLSELVTSAEGQAKLLLREKH